MAWITITEKPTWEYSTAPNTDKKAIDSYDYDLFTDHVLGIITGSSGVKYALSRQKTHPHPGYGEIYIPT